MIFRLPEPGYFQWQGSDQNVQPIAIKIELNLTALRYNSIQKAIEFAKDITKDHKPANLDYFLHLIKMELIKQITIDITGVQEDPEPKTQDGAKTPEGNK